MHTSQRRKSHPYPINQCRKQESGDRRRYKPEQSLRLIRERVVDPKIGQLPDNDAAQREQIESTGVVILSGWRRLIN